MRNASRVIVTFLETGPVDLQARGIDAGQAAALWAQLAACAEEWDNPEMALYDHVVEVALDRVIGALPMADVEMALRPTLHL